MRGGLPALLAARLSGAISRGGGMSLPGSGGREAPAVQDVASHGRLTLAAVFGLSGIREVLFPMTAKSRTGLLTTTQMYHLDQACQMVTRAFGGECPYLVGTAGIGGADSYRDVDVRLMLGDEEFAAVCPTRERWELLSLSIGAYLSERSGLPIDFQVQRTSEANAKHGRQPRNPLGMGGVAARIFAGGGDGTPGWGAA